MNFLKKNYLTQVYYFSYCFLIALLLNNTSLFAQTSKYKIWNPASEAVNCLEGQGWTGQAERFFYRFPEKAQKTVRKEVWGLSTNTAGVAVRFTTNAKEIIVKYQNGGSRLQMPHMPALGVSGVDLYQVYKNGKTERVNGKYSFEDTVQYSYPFLSANSYTEYVLYLPLYNSVKWMEIWVPAESDIHPIAPRTKPIVIYGTSIAQGGCASRPGMASTNILSRNINRHVINLAFSGNGRMEPEVIDLLAEIDASVYVIDCLPNLGASPELPKKINYAVTTLKKKRPNVPILFVDHCGLPIGNPGARNKNVDLINKQQRSVFDSLVKSGVKGLYYLTRGEINLDENCVVDYVHPNDIGMMRYADAYEKALRKIWKGDKKKI